METLLVFGTALVLLAGMPFLISRMMGRARHERQQGSYGIGFDGALDVFDPAKGRSREVIQIQQEVGETDEGYAGELLRRRSARIATLKPRDG